MLDMLPFDGSAFYVASWLSEATANAYFNALLTEIDWQHDEVLAYGKQISTRRKTAWLADEGLSYKYSGILRKPTPWTPTVLAIKQRVEKDAGESFNACLLNYYQSGQEGMGWHSDSEPEIVEASTIASVSLGATRRFQFRHKLEGLKQELLLESGSLLLMKGDVQQYWQHQVPKMLREKEPRISLTFRIMVTPDPSTYRADL